MMITTEIFKEISQDSNLAQIKEITGPMLGQVCWEARVSYGDELCLEIGDKIPFFHKKMARRLQGAWRFGTRGTECRLVCAGELITSSGEDVDVFREKVKVVEETTITIFETLYPDLVLKVGFSSGCDLIVIPDFDDGFDMAYWELFTPGQMLLEMGPGRVWSFSRSDVPMGEKRPVFEAGF